MGMFDQEIPEYVSGPQRIRRAGSALGDQLAPGVERMTGYSSPKRKAKAIANSTDLSSMASIQDSYKKIQKINPTAASSWLKDVMTTFTADTARKQSTAKSSPKVSYQKGGLPGDPTKTILLSNVSGTMQPVLNKQGKPYIEDKYQTQSLTGTLPQGYRMNTNTGTMELIPGSPADVEKKGAIIASKAKEEGAVRSSTLVNNTIGRLRGVITGAKKNDVDTVFGWGGKGASYAGVPNSERMNAESLVTTIESHIGFDRLDRMRKESPTGGALGQVSEMELRQLNATLGRLNFEQSEEQFLVTLKQVQDEYDYIMRKIAETGDGTFTNDAAKNNNPLGIDL